VFSLGEKREKWEKWERWRKKCELCGIGIRLRACCVLRLVSESCVFNAVCLLHCDVACGMWHSLYCDWVQSKATIDFPGLSQVKLNLKNALKFYCIPISLSSFIIMCILLAVMLTPCLFFSRYLIFSLSLCLFLSLYFLLTPLLLYSMYLCPLPFAFAPIYAQNLFLGVLLLLIVVVAVVVVDCCWQRLTHVAIKSVACVCVQIKSHKIKQYPSLIWHFGATLMRLVAATDAGRCHIKRGLKGGGVAKRLR